jgi:hypothetical protein
VKETFCPIGSFNHDYMLTERNISFSIAGLQYQK